ncbi:MAG: sensor histidine kinase [Candidatus Muiribacteriota bacterium]
MKSALVLFEKALDSKEYMELLRFKFGFNSIFEKIGKEIIYSKNFEYFLNSIFSELKEFLPDNDFSVKIWDIIEFSTCGEKNNKKDVLNIKLEFLSLTVGSFAVYGEEVKSDWVELLKFLSSQISLYYIFFNKDSVFNQISSGQQSISQINYKYNELNKINKILSNFFLKDTENDNIYLFSKSVESDEFNYVENFKSREVDFNSSEHSSMLNSLIEKALFEKYKVVELNSSQKRIFSAMFGIRASSYLVLTIRNIEEVLGILIITSKKRIDFDFEKIIPVYSLYYEKLFTFLNKVWKEKKQAQLNEIYKLASKIIEKHSLLKEDKNTDMLFGFFMKHFDLEETGLYFINEKKEIQKWYSSSERLRRNLSKINFHNATGFIKDMNDKRISYNIYKIGKFQKGVLFFVFKNKTHLTDYKLNAVYHTGLLLFNILYSKNMAERLQELDRYAVIGKMAREMAHEIRNPLGGIKLYIEMLKKRLEDSSNREIFEGIQSGIISINNVIHSMLQFNCENEISKKNINIKQIISETFKTFPLKNKVNLEIINNSSLEEIFCDKEKIKRVFVNILKNAHEALENRKNKKVRVIINDEEDGVVFSFWNNGGEISSEEKKNLFMPFYTTKDGGNGLGLVIVKKIINLHNGNISVKNENGWTGFNIFLPGGN